MMMTAIAVAAQLAQYIPKLIAAGIDAWDAWQTVKRVRDENRAPGDPEWDKLNADVEALEVRFDQAAKPRPPGT